MLCVHVHRNVSISRRRLVTDDMWRGAPWPGGGHWKGEFCEFAVMLTYNTSHETMDQDSNYLVDWRIRTNAETPAIKALYDLMSIIPGGSVRLRRLKMVSVDFLAKGNRLVRTHPYHLQRVTASVRIRPASLVDGDGTNLGTLNDTIAPSFW